MARYAIVNSTLVENVILANATPTIPGRTVVLLSAGQAVGPGDTYNGTVFTPYVPTARDISLGVAPLNLKQAYATLRTWATQAHASSGTYAASSAAAQAATVATTLDRLGTFLDRFADWLLIEGLDQ